jgi:hypothetical protein
MIAHIFKAKGGKWRLVISRSASITSDQVISDQLFDGKVDAKRAAKSLGAKAHNY